MPGQDGVGSDNRRDLSQDLSPEQLAFRGYAATLVVRQTETLLAELLPKDAVLLLEEINDVLLVLIDPARECCQQHMPGSQVVEHPAILRRCRVGSWRGAPKVWPIR